MLRPWIQDGWPTKHSIDDARGVDPNNENELSAVLVRGSLATHPRKFETWNCCIHLALGVLYQGTYVVDIWCITKYLLDLLQIDEDMEGTRIRRSKRHWQLNNALLSLGGISLNQIDALQVHSLFSRPGTFQSCLSIITRPTYELG